DNAEIIQSDRVLRTLLASPRRRHPPRPRRIKVVASVESKQQDKKAQRLPALALSLAVLVAGGTLAGWLVARAHGGPAPPVVALPSGPSRQQAEAAVQAARARPDDPAAQLRLGSVLVTSGRHQE